MAKQTWWISKRDQTLSGLKVTKGQLIRPSGAVNDHIVFGDNSRWAHRYDGSDPLTCGVDGCPAQLDTLGSLDHHRFITHAPEINARAQAKAEAAREAEERGDTIGGHEVIKAKVGPGGEVPYIAPYSRQ